jgi:YidC/Oxa1 family membrane protein insertase
VGELWGLIGTVWNAAIIGPMVNSLVLLYSIFFSNFGITIIFFTIIVRTVLIPLTIKQSRQMKMMSSLQPKLKEIQQRYANDRQKISQETMRLYREQGVNPLGCLGPMFIQMPIWIGLYRALLTTLPSTPESMVGLSGHLYSWLPRVSEAIPLDSSFLWLDLALPDSTPVLPVLVGASMWLMQKMTTMPAADPKQQSTNRMMLWMMPLMFGFFSLSFPSGLALYWVVSNLIGVVIQGFVTGWGPLESAFLFLRGVRAPGEAPALVTPAEEIVSDGTTNDRDDGQDQGRGHRDRPKRARRRSRRGRNRRR